MKYSYSGKVESDLVAIRYFIQDILEELNTIIVNREKLLDIKLIMSELMINSAIHGNKMDECKCVYLDMELEGHDLELYIKDEGCGVSYDKKEYDPLAMDSGGRGLILVYGLSEEVILENDTVFVKMII